MATALTTLLSLPTVPLAPHVTPIDRLTRLEAALGSGSPQLFMKRDDLLSFGLGGNKVRKMQAVAAEAIAAGADTLITCGGVQSNHCRVTAAAGAALGLAVELVVNGTAPAAPAGNARLDRLFGASIHYVSNRDQRAPKMQEIADRLAREGRRPFIVPLGASTATGALGFARGIKEIATGGLRPDAIVFASSSGGTQAGLVAGCALFGLTPRIIGISADESASTLAGVVHELVNAVAAKLGAKPETVGATRGVEVDDGFVGEGYGVPTPASIEATELVARREGIVLDPVYTAKAMAGLLARVRRGEFTSNQAVLFWHTGGIPGYFT
ncbi:MAG TPA: D-cysteine desulfhydrase family protein [Vicinamibacterales bacterium]|nr:D-cysteine desulfhydrase family protein [Vicinamibacterales bacterium]